VCVTFTDCITRVLFGDGQLYVQICVVSAGSVSRWCSAGCGWTLCCYWSH